MVLVDTEAVINARQFLAVTVGGIKTDTTITI